MRKSMEGHELLQEFLGENSMDSTMSGMVKGRIRGMRQNDETLCCLV